MRTNRKLIRERDKQYQLLIRRFTVPLAHCHSVEALLAHMMGAVVVSMTECSADQIECINKLVDADKVRVLQR